MPAIVLKDHHFLFMRKLVEAFIETADDDVPREVQDTAKELQILLNYTKHFKNFTVVIAEDSTDVEEDPPEGHIN